MANGNIGDTIKDARTIGEFVKVAGPWSVTLILAVVLAWGNLSGSWSDRWTATQEAKAERAQVDQIVEYVDKSMRQHVDRGPHKPMPEKIAGIEATMHAMKEQLDRIEHRQINGGG